MKSGYSATPKAKNVPADKRGQFWITAMCGRGLRLMR